MSIKATILAGALGLPLLAGTAFAAETKAPTLIDAAKAGDHAAVRTLLNGPAKSYVAGPQGTAALIWAAEHNDVQTVDLLLAAGADPKAANEYGATPLYAAAISFTVMAGSALVAAA